MFSELFCEHFCFLLGAMDLTSEEKTINSKSEIPALGSTSTRLVPNRIMKSTSAQNSSAYLVDQLQRQQHPIPCEHECTLHW